MFSNELGKGSLRGDSVPGPWELRVNDAQEACVEPLQEVREVRREGRQARLFLKPGFERHTRVSRQVLPRPRHIVETLL